MALDEHRLYLSDQRRLDAFSKAIGEVVRKDSTVLDLASGSGILGLMACRAGAARVYAVEIGGIVELIRQTAADNGYGNRVVAVRGHSMHVELPERVDVVVADQIGHFGFDVGICDVFADARSRFLKPGGVTIPANLELALCPVEATDAFAMVEFWDTNPAGFSFGCARAVAGNTDYPMNFQGGALLSFPQRVAVLEFKHPSANALDADLKFIASRTGILHGLGGWFFANLAPGIRMTNSPIAEDRINRQQRFFPIDRPVPIAADDAIHVKARILTQDKVVNLAIEVRDGASGKCKGRFRHASLKGMLLSSEDLERTHPDFEPVLSRRGAAWRMILDLCDGQRTVAEIEKQVHAQHPELCSSRVDAQSLVAEVIQYLAK